MQSFAEMQKIPQCTSPTSLKDISLEWSTDFEYTDKIIDFIGLQKNLEHLHIGLIRSNNPTVRDSTKTLKGLLSLNKLKSFHVLSSSPSMFKPGCFGTYSKIIKNSANLELFGISYLTPLSTSVPGVDNISWSSKFVELGPSIYEMLDELSFKKNLSGLYLNFRVKPEKAVDLQPIIQRLNTFPKIKTLSLALDQFYKKELKDEEVDIIKEIFAEISHLKGVKNLIFGASSSVEIRGEVRDELKKLFDVIPSLRGLSISTNLHAKLLDKFHYSL